MEGVMTDPSARRFVFQNFHFFPEASDDGSVMLFGWDNERFIMPRHQNIIIQVGRNDQASSRELTFQIPNEMMQRPFFQMRYRTQFVESESEAAIEINGYRFPLTVSNQNSEPQLLEIPIKALRRGQNVFKFLYNENSRAEKFKGYIIYYLEFVP
ncbi:MAG: hypothetical protein KIS77_14435 [Saprospiraceae bacterium]|nr:hypothetical protein [Saprospiraceae bacterium]